jgi:hypothetical protein
VGFYHYCKSIVALLQVTVYHAMMDFVAYVQNDEDASN